ncbi:MAG: hypothetical protein LBB98_00200 [Treponema sp.]|nr:hypothetical protein [Treponema sp.]
MLKIAESILDDQNGSAVYHNATFHKETTLGENEDLFYNSPAIGQHSGW